MTTTCKTISSAFDMIYANGGGRVFTGSIYLLNFNINIGIGSNSSILDLELVVDPCGTDAGVGFTLPDVGRAVKFFSTTTAFAFGGIINSASVSESSNGYTYKFKIIDPRKILDNVSVLLKDYYCNDAAIATMPNFINFAYFQEGVTCAVCPPGEDSQNWPRVQSCTGFGTSGPGTSSSQNGISLLKVLQRLQIDSGGRIFTTSGADQLNLDLSRLIAVTPEWSITSSSSMTIGEIIDQASRDAACDTFTTLEGNTIIIWTVDRSVAVTSSPITYLIKQAKSTGTLINSEEGEVELYEKSNRIIIGDNVNYLSEVSFKNNVDMMLGYLEDGSIVRAQGTPFKGVKINTSAINTLLGGGLGDSFAIDETEILATKTQEIWLLYGAIKPNSLSARIQTILGINALMNEMLVAFTTINNANDPDTINDNLAKIKGINQAPADQQTDDLLKFIQCWRWFTNFVQEYYGKKWFIPINSPCVYPANPPEIIQGEGGPYLLSDYPTSDGYPSPSQQNGNILQLKNKEFFETTDGKYNGFLRFNSKDKVSAAINRQPVDFTFSSHTLDSNSLNESPNIFIKINGALEIIRYKNKSQILVESDMIPLINFPGGKRILTTALRTFAALFPDKLNQLKDQGINPIQSLNIFQLTPVAARPEAACVPMKSNIYVYGPWGSSSLSIGSTDVVVDSSLNPWSFGGYSAMNIAGEALALQAIRPVNKEFSGSVTIAEPPGWNIQYFIQNYAMILDSMNVVYGAQGSTTTYSFKTHIPKFGQYGQAVSATLQQMNKDRSSSIKLFKENRKKSRNEINSILNDFEKRKYERNPFKKDPNEAADNKNSPSVLLIGGFFDTVSKNNSSSDSGQSESVATAVESLTCEELKSYTQSSGSTGTESVTGSGTIKRTISVGLYPQNEVDMSFSNEAFWNIGSISIDGLFSPVSIDGRHDRLSRFSEYTAKNTISSVTNKTPIHRSRPVMPPITTNKLNIHQEYINPITSYALLSKWDDRKGSSTKGFNILFLTYGDKIQEIFGTDEKRQAETDFGFLGLRGPLVLQSWGYDTEGKPIPNAVDSPSDTESGKFKRHGTKNKFMPNWLSNPKTWPVGPIDLRWDRDRGVWVSPPSERILVAQLIEELSPYKSAKAILLNPSADSKIYYDDYPIYGDNGENLGTSLKSVQITIYDYLGRSICKGSRVYAYYEDKRYIVLESNIGSSSDNSCCSSESSSSESSSSESESECPNDDCGLSSCFTSLGTAPGLIGLNESNCLTLYPFTECEETSESDFCAKIDECGGGGTDGGSP